MNHAYRLYTDPDSIIIAIGQNWYRLNGDVWGPDLRTEFPSSSPAASGSCAVRENGGQRQFSFTYPQGSFHILAEGTHAWATAGVDGTSPKTSGQLEGQTGETAEQRIRAYLFRK